MIETKRSPRTWRRAIACVLALAGAVAAPLAQADTIVLAESAYISGTQSTVYSLAAPSAGTLTVKLDNLAWPARLSSLSFALTTATGVLQTLSGEGQVTLDVSNPGTYYAIVSGTAQGRWNIGMYSLNIAFSQLGGPAPVPLPGALWLLLSGFAGLLGLTRRQANRALMPTPAY